MLKGKWRNLLLFVVFVIVISLTISTNFQNNQKITPKNRLTRVHISTNISDFSIPPTPVCKFNSSEESEWKWCHDEMENICKANYPLLEKRTQLIFLLQHVGKVLDKLEVRWWLDSGTLLGAVRDGRIIPWDYNVNIGVVDGEFREKYFQIMKELHSCDNSLYPVYWKSRSNFTNLIGSFMMKEEPQFSLNVSPWLISYDIHRLTKAGWGNGVDWMSLAMIFPLHTIKLEGETFPLPFNPAIVLERRYGKWEEHIQNNFFFPDLTWPEQFNRTILNRWQNHF